MQEIKNAVAVFCTACVCAELVAQLMDDGRLRRCIKAAAGLYILVALAHALPGLRAEAKVFVLPRSQAADFGEMEDAVLRQAERQLAAALEEQCTEQTGQVVRMKITLVQTSAGVAAVAVQAAVSADCPAEAREQIADFLRGALGVEDVEWTAGEEEL